MVPVTKTWSAVLRICVIYYPLAMLMQIVLGPIIYRMSVLPVLIALFGLLSIVLAAGLAGADFGRAFVRQTERGFQKGERWRVLSWAALAATVPAQILSFARIWPLLSGTVGSGSSLVAMMPLVLGGFITLCFVYFCLWLGATLAAKRTARQFPQDRAEVFR